ncbi:MAG: bis(5'-nucleosyl)-tetraphosphatase (symmetrical) YqeK [Oscillospiraceae bacterium]|nr:bis(5'-nucleosyl)-tetraphosphatase (symmetrical) YqeK [Oscillospiraceae bacterium]
MTQQTPPKTREDCRRVIEPLLPPDRLWHSECVADAAEALARQVGADGEKAMLAGMLHDCAKVFPPEEQRALCARYGKPLTVEDGRSPKIWHAFAGEAYLALNCGVTDQEILSAVRWHTTGHGGMTKLEETVFVADLISAERTYPDVEKVRELAARDIHAASIYVLEFIFLNLKRQGRHDCHTATLAWYRELTQKEDAT